MGYISDWDFYGKQFREAREAMERDFPGCLAGTVGSLRCTAPKHNFTCNRSRFERGFGIWCREETNQGKCVRLQGHKDDHKGINE